MQLEFGLCAHQSFLVQCSYLAVNRKKVLNIFWGCLAKKIEANERPQWSQRYCKQGGANNTGYLYSLPNRRRASSSSCRQNQCHWPHSSLLCVQWADSDRPRLDSRSGEIHGEIILTRAFCLLLYSYRERSVDLLGLIPYHSMFDPNTLVKESFQFC